MSSEITPFSLSSGFLQAVEERRTHYLINSESTLSNAQIQQLVEHAVKHTPTAFNMQSSRAIIVTGTKNKEIWEIIKADHMKTLSDTAEIERMDGRFAGFARGYGTILFFEDQEVLKEWAGKLPFFSTLFGDWSANSTGMLQYIVWTALKAEGMGASLQHFGGFNPEIQVDLTKALGVPPTWTSAAIMPFGKITGPPGRPGVAKEFAPIEDRVKTFFGRDGRFIPCDHHST